MQEENYKKSRTLHLSRQEIAFWGECRKIKGCGSLEGDFYTGFIPEKRGFGAVKWLMN